MELTTSSNRSSESDPDAARHQRYLLHHDVACRVFFVFFLYCDSLIFQPVKTVQSSTKRDNKVVASLKILYSVNIRHAPDISAASRGSVRAALHLRSVFLKL